MSKWTTKLMVWMPQREPNWISSRKDAFRSKLMCLNSNWTKVTNWTIISYGDFDRDCTSQGWEPEVPLGKQKAISQGFSNNYTCLYSRHILNAGNLQQYFWAQNNKKAKTLAKKPRKCTNYSASSIPSSLHQISDFSTFYRLNKLPKGHNSSCNFC